MIRTECRKSRFQKHDDQSRTEVVFFRDQKTFPLGYFVHWVSKTRFKSHRRPNGLVKTVEKEVPPF